MHVAQAALIVKLTGRWQLLASDKAQFFRDEWLRAFQMSGIGDGTRGKFS